MIYILAFSAALILAGILITKFHLGGADLSSFDVDTPPSFSPDKDGPGHDEVRAFIHENFTVPAKSATSGNRGSGWESKRARFDAAGLAREFDAEFRPAVIDAGGHEISGEWTLVKGADPDQRVLYLHGGAFVAGSAISHRPITYNIAKRTGCAVFAPNYRLMPENKRIECVQDCETAYRWILENGPDGPAPVKKLAVAGDSAGGNLTIRISHWSGEAGLRRPDAVVGISAALDTTMSAPSIRGNFETDQMLKPLVGPLLKIPQPVLLWLSWRGYGMSPASPVISPLFDDLSDIPPTLLHVSASEMLYDDSRRYAEKARQSGGNIRLQSWEHMCHVWHIFDDMIAESHHAHDEIARFLGENGVGSFT